MSTKNKYQCVHESDFFFISYISHYLKGVTSVCYTKQVRLYSYIYFEARQGFDLTLGLISMQSGCLDVLVAIVGFPGTGGLFNSSILRLLEFL